MQDMNVQLVQSSAIEPMRRGQGSKPGVRVAAASAFGSATAGAENTQSGAVSVSNLKQAVERMNNEMQDANRGLRFSVDDESGRIVVKVVDTDTDEVIRQIPAEEMLALARMASSGDGHLFDVEA